ncbi:MAG: phosphatase PAP2 family protein [Bacteroidia bacterium]|nr:phosphatase PAP2 family protein [Bacteroidia bacterium]MDW8089519.1 phosphatase PAP2 family protein [Bacteroidia bacterium]
MEFLQTWDERLLLWLNQAGTPKWDAFMWYVTQTWVWVPLFVGLGIWLFRRYRRRMWKPLLSVLVSIGLTDGLTGRVLKPWIARRRPSHQAALQSSLRIVRGYRGGLYGFPSSHAANSAALLSALWVWWRYPLLLPIGLGWVVLHSCSRIYLGVHYPSDILAGWLIGASLGYLVSRLFLRFVWV